MGGQFEAKETIVGWERARWAVARAKGTAMIMKMAKAGAERMYIVTVVVNLVSSSLAAMYQRAEVLVHHRLNRQC